MSALGTSLRCLEDTAPFRSRVDSGHAADAVARPPLTSRPLTGAFHLCRFNLASSHPRSPRGSDYLYAAHLDVWPRMIVSAPIIQRTCPMSAADPNPAILPRPNPSTRLPPTQLAPL